MDSIKKDKVQTKLKCMILISLCCCTFENTATHFKDAATRLSYKLLLKCPKQSWLKTRIECQRLHIGIPLTDAGVTTAEGMLQKPWNNR